MRLPNRPVTVAQLDEVAQKLLDTMHALSLGTRFNDEQWARLRREVTALITKVPAEEPAPNRVHVDGGDRTWDDEAKQRAKIADERSMAGAGK